MALAALALVVFGAYDSYPFFLVISQGRLTNASSTVKRFLCITIILCNNPKTGKKYSAKKVF